MLKNMLGIALRTLSGPLHDLFQKLEGPDGEVWFYAFKRFLRKEDPWQTRYGLGGRTRTIDGHNVELLRVPLARMGFKEGANYGDVCVRAGELGFLLHFDPVKQQFDLFRHVWNRGDWELVSDFSEARKDFFPPDTSFTLARLKARK